MRTLSRLLVFSSIAILLAGNLSAQSQANTGSIEGSVSDPSGSAIPGASVVVQNTDTNFQRKLTTDESGRFRAVLLPLGAYTVTVSAPRFGTLARKGLELAVGQSISLPLTLQVANVTETVNVEGEAGVIETSAVERSSYIDKNAMRTLPNNGRNFLDFMNLTPGVTIVQGPDGNEISVNGQKGIANNVSIDGADNNNPFFGEQRGGQRPAFTVNLDAVKEFAVVADGAPAEFGRSSGGFINVVTKSGTNQAHGTLHEYFKQSALVAKQSDGTPISDFNQNQFGGTIGGPIRKDKLFFFVAYDQQVFRQTKQNNAGRIDARLVNFFSSRYGISDENGPIKRTNDANALLGKVDYNANDRNLITLRYNFSRSDQTNGTFDVDSYARSANAVEKGKVNTFSSQWNATLSPTTLNEFRFQFSREDRPRSYNGPNISGQSRPLPDTGVDFAGSYRFGLPFFIPVEDFDTRYQVNNNLTLIRGAHTFKLGFELNRTSTTQTVSGFANGRYIFSSVQGFINYATQGPKYVECSNGTSNITGACPTGTDITGPLQLFLQFAGVNGKSVRDAGTQSIPNLEPALFVQDKWQVNRRLTLSYGLRWDAQIMPDPQTPPSQVFYAPLLNKPGFPSDGRIPSSKKQFQPRLGVTWDPTGKGKSVIRVNGGIFYARTPGLMLASPRSTNGSIGQTIFRASFFNGFGVTPPAYPNLIPDAGNTVPQNPDVFVFDRNFTNPRTYSWSATYEQQVAPAMKVFGTFSYAKGVHLARYVNRNDAVFGSPWSTGIGAGNGLGQLTTAESSAKSLFRGVTFGVNKQFSSRWQMQANYQISVDKSDDDSERDPFSFRYAKANDFRPDYNYSDRDQRHRFNLFGLWQGPAGIEISPRFSARSAQPFSVGASPADRIRKDGSVIQRNTLRKNNQFYSFDFRAAKSFKLSERLRLQGMVDVFNLFNAANPKKPEVTGLLFNFDGTITSGLGDPRQAQLGVKLIF